MSVNPCEADGSSEWGPKFLAAAPGLLSMNKAEHPSMAVSRLTKSGITPQRCVPNTQLMGEAGAALSEEAIAHYLGVLSPRFYTFSAECLLHTSPQTRSESLSRQKIL